MVREPLKTRSYTEARRLKSSMEYELDRGLYRAPSRTPLRGFLEEYLSFLHSRRTRKSYKNDVSYLRLWFGPLCEELEPRDSTGRSLDGRAWLKGRPVKPIQAEHLEETTPQDISAFIAARIRTDQIARKTANRTREVRHRLFAYAVKHRSFRSPDGRSPNPVALVERISYAASCLRILSLAQVEEQLKVLERCVPPMERMVATLIYVRCSQLFGQQMGLNKRASPSDGRWKVRNPG